MSQSYTLSLSLSLSFSLSFFLFLSFFLNHQEFRTSYFHLPTPNPSLPTIAIRQNLGAHDGPFQPAVPHIDQASVASSTDVLIHPISSDNLATGGSVPDMAGVNERERPVSAAPFRKDRARFFIGSEAEDAKEPLNQQSEPGSSYTFPDYGPGEQPGPEKEPHSRVNDDARCPSRQDVATAPASPALTRHTSVRACDLLSYFIETLSFICIYTQPFRLVLITITDVLLT